MRLICRSLCRSHTAIATTATTDDYVPDGDMERRNRCRARSAGHISGRIDTALQQWGRVDSDFKPASLRRGGHWWSRLATGRSRIGRRRRIPHPLWNWSAIPGSSNDVRVTFGGTNVPVEYVGEQKEFAGLDQLNLKLPKSFAGRSGPLIITINGGASNLAYLSF